MLNFTQIHIVECDIRTASGKLYPKAVIEEAIKNIKEPVMGSFVNADITLDVTKITHKITNIKLIGNILIGDIQVLDTPYGVMLQQYITNNDTKFKLCLAGIGKLSEDNIVSEYQLNRIDVEMSQ